jgi:hypothetical protein
MQYPWEMVVVADLFDVLRVKPGLLFELTPDTRQSVFPWFQAPGWQVIDDLA